MEDDLDRSGHFKPGFTCLEGEGDIHIAHALTEAAHSSQNIQVTVCPDYSGAGRGQAFFHQDMGAYASVHVKDSDLLFSGKITAFLLVIRIFQRAGRST